MADKSEFNLKGQMLNFSLPLTDAVSCVLILNILKFRTPEKIAIITLKLEQYHFTTE